LKGDKNRKKIWNFLDIKWELNENLKWYLYNKDLGFEIIFNCYDDIREVAHPSRSIRRK